MMRCLLAAVLGASMCLSLPASATEISSITGEGVAALVRDAGYKAVLSTDEVGDPLIESAADGAKFFIIFYDCEAGSCRALQFRVGFDEADGVPMSLVNEWNRSRRYGKAYVDDVNDPWLEMELDFETGTTQAQVSNYIQLWAGVLAEFRKYIVEAQPGREQPASERLPAPGRSS